MTSSRKIQICPSAVRPRYSIGASVSAQSSRYSTRNLVPLPVRVKALICGVSSVFSSTAQNSSAASSFIVVANVQPAAMAEKSRLPFSASAKVVLPLRLTLMHFVLSLCGTICPMAAETVGFSGETRAVRETTARHSSETSKITSMVRRPCLIFWAENRPFFTLSQM